MESYAVCSSASTEIFIVLFFLSDYSSTSIPYVEQNMCIQTRTIVRLNRPSTCDIFFFAGYKNIFEKDWLEENPDFPRTDLEWNRVQFLGKRFIEETLINDNVSTTIEDSFPLIRSFLYIQLYFLF